MAIKMRESEKEVERGEEREEVEREETKLHSFMKKMGVPESRIEEELDWQGNEALEEIYRPLTYKGKMAELREMYTEHEYLEKEAEKRLPGINFEDIGKVVGEAAEAGNLPGVGHVSADEIKGFTQHLKENYPNMPPEVAFHALVGFCRVLSDGNARALIHENNLQVMGKLGEDYFHLTGDPEQKLLIPDLSEDQLERMRQALFEVKKQIPAVRLYMKQPAGLFKEMEEIGKLRKFLKL